MAGLYEDNVKPFLELVSHPQDLVNQRDGIALALCTGGALSGACIFFGVAGWIAALIFLAAALLVYGFWWTWREYRWRWAHGKKVGLVFSGDRQPLRDELDETRRRLARLFHEDARRTRVSLRLVPTETGANPVKLAKFIEKYDFAVALSFEVSTRLSDSNKRAYSIKLGARTRAQLDKEFLAATARHMVALIQNRPMADSVSALLNRNAQNLADVILLALGILYLSEDKPLDATAILHSLEKGISDRFRPDQQPRLAIRWLDMRALSRPSSFPDDGPANPQVLEHAIEMCELALSRYESQFFEPFVTQARNFFFAGRLEEAIAHAEKLLRFTDEPDALANGHLDLAVLHLFRGHWSKAGEYFERFFESSLARGILARGLVDFADGARKQGYEEAVFLQATYRKALGQLSAQDPLYAEAMKWLKEDRSRGRLQAVFEYRARPPRSPKKAARTLAASKRLNQPKRRTKKRGKR